MTLKNVFKTSRLLVLETEILCFLSRYTALSFAGRLWLFKRAIYFLWWGRPKTIEFSSIKRIVEITKNNVRYTTRVFWIVLDESIWDGWIRR